MPQHRTSTCILRTFLIALLVTAGRLLAGPFIVEDGAPRAAIVIAAQPPRMANIAAEELQLYIEKITGARLPVLTAPTNAYPVTVYVGRSEHTDRLGIRDEGLNYGAFRMVAGEDWLVLLGHDEDFTPPEPFPYNNTSIPEAVAKWDEITGEPFGLPIATLYKAKDRGGKLGVPTWEHDQRGSVNAVYAFLRMHGVRWYMPGELGETCPKTSSIPLPVIDTTVRPDFDMRDFAQYGQAWSMTSREEMLWHMRLGLYNGWDVRGPTIGHGILLVTNREETKKKHPEYYALHNDTRALEHAVPCLSSEGLLQANIRFARIFFDHFDAPMLSVMPTDGFSICQCALCQGKATPERGYDGVHSDYVWGYVNRVAKELYKTHPDKKLICHSYTTYTQPPTTIEKLSPNVVVGICQGRRFFYNEERRQDFVRLRQAWLEKSPNQQFTYEYYNHGRPGKGQLPVVFPHIIAKDLQSLKGISRGEFAEVYRERNSIRNLAVNHLNLYVTARCYWDAELDVDALLEEYYGNFYGPARDEMKAFFEFAEQRWMHMSKNKEDIDTLFALLDKGRAAAGNDALVGQRIDLIVDSVQPLKELRAKLEIGRKDTPEAYAVRRDAGDLVLDGKLDEAFWGSVRSYGLRELESGGKPEVQTRFWVGSTDNAIYFGIRCDEPDMANLKITATEDGDTAIWEGDNIEILIETQSHAYYQFVISPAGALVDVDWHAGINTLWNSGAQAAAYRGEDYWSLELRLPIAGELQAEVDPDNGIVGRMPTKTYPWYFNVCRQRLGADGASFSAFSPTGEMSFHVPLKFGKLIQR